MKNLSVGAAAWAMGLLAIAGNAEAQEAQAGGAVSPPLPTSSPPAAAPKTAVVTTTTEPESTTPDHEQFVGHFAVGYFGISQLPIAGLAAPGGGGAPGLARDNVNAPVIGVRYWLSRNLGIDAGVGFGLTGGSVETVPGNNNDKPSKFGLALHGGVPLAFAHGKHYTFELVPETTIGFASGTIKTNGQPDIDLSGFRFDLGARVGAELYFGFIGVPQLSLQGSVGLYFRREAFKMKQGDASVSDGTTTVGTSVQSDPWALFTNNISAFYYF